MLHGHGDDGYRFGGKISADFSTNVWYGGEPEGLKAHIFEHWADINRYPEVIGESLTAKIASHHDLEKDQLLVTSGTTESIYLIAQLFAGKKTTIVTPSFSEYEDACATYGHEMQFLSWKDALEMPRLKTDVVFICNPNNPTGFTFPDLQFWLRINRQCVFVVDEAFIDFAPSAQSVIGLLDQFDNLVIMRSLTKAYAIPGLRLGYIVTKNEWIDQLLRIRQPWSVNALALAAGHFIFDHFESVQPPFAELLADRVDFVAQLRQNEALEIEDSDTHFFLAKTLIRNAAQLKTFLIDNYQILIRDAGNFRSLTRQHFRLATLSPQKNQLLINALEEWTKRYY
ncbi:pyridoxal phosphate-dependent aminotransferase [Dyadobacter aurulentus]|uniref:pyridoxal phosphate-dependent aminotransferase n=1 Tax=Dyadobacter sp. UC 10 TaxID=2605428 RepID=UPI0011F38EDD|nr:aminotransferase class I/II-fold pyridoxal phosphate-dependent enzyme [Dyadobacter sp. UC 10]KAA0993330.1 aminotransferase class I/II-fold pyridoxal phosphate-dependent enzyme [Dyadobacter sp. UC 10]